MAKPRKRAVAPGLDQPRRSSRVVEKPRNGVGEGLGIVGLDEQSIHSRRE